MSIARELQMAAAGVGAGGGGVSPADIADLQLWLDATDASTLFQDTAKTTSASANNDPVGCWEDKSGNGFDFDQSTSARRPTLDTGTMSLNSLNLVPTADSNAGQWLENSTCTDTITLFQVLQYNNNSAGVSFGIGASYNGYFTFNSSLTTNYVAAAGPIGSSGFRTVGGSYSRIALGNDAIISGDLMNFLRENGTQYAINSPYNYSSHSSNIGSYIGRRGLSVPNDHKPFNGNVGEVIAYDRRLSSIEIGQVESYLSTKWSITI